MNFLKLMYVNPIVVTCYMVAIAAWSCSFSTLLCVSMVEIALKSSNRNRKSGVADPTQNRKSGMADPTHLLILLLLSLTPCFCLLFPLWLVCIFDRWPIFSPVYLSGKLPFLFLSLSFFCSVIPYNLSLNPSLFCISLYSLFLFLATPFSLLLCFVNSDFLSLCFKGRISCPLFFSLYYLILSCLLVTYFFPKLCSFSVFFLRVCVLYLSL